ncbi:MAG TPA: acyl-CoA dehydrogenase family protein [Myxococcota bacterium]|nr:acyl-CoA dehydrogenase family protein [Myxococcota bacterium]
MDFAWSEDQAQLRAGVAEVGRSLNDGLRERERESKFDRAGWKKLADAGVHGLPIPEEFGGIGADALTTVGVLESLGHACRDNGLVFSVNAHMWTLEIPILHFGSDEQKRRFLPKLVSGEWIGGNAMSEPASGSDAYSLSTTAELRGDRYLLNGSKVFVSNGPVADVIMAFATVDKARGARGVTGFLIEKGTPGFQAIGATRKMGMRTSPMCELFLENCEVPVENRLGKEGAGTNLFTHSMTWERACILASAVGSMQRLLDVSIAYARERKQFGRAIGSFQLVASRIVDMKLRLETARALLYQAAWQRSRGRSIFLEAALAKLHISESWVRCAEDAMQIHGGYGYMEDYEIERDLRDAYGSRIFSGTSEIQRTIVATLLGLPAST